MLNRNQYQAMERAHLNDDYVAVRTDACHASESLGFGRAVMALASDVEVELYVVSSEQCSGDCLWSWHRPNELMAAALEELDASTFEAYEDAISGVSYRDVTMVKELLESRGLIRSGLLVQGLIAEVRFWKHDFTAFTVEETAPTVDKDLW